MRPLSVAVIWVSPPPGARASRFFPSAIFVSPPTQKSGGGPPCIPRGCFPSLPPPGYSPRAPENSPSLGGVLIPPCFETPVRGHIRPFLGPRAPNLPAHYPNLPPEIPPMEGGNTVFFHTPLSQEGPLGFPRGLWEPKTLGPPGRFHNLAPFRPRGTGGPPFFWNLGPPNGPQKGVPRRAKKSPAQRGLGKPPDPGGSPKKGENLGDPPEILPLLTRAARPFKKGKAPPSGFLGGTPQGPGYISPLGFPWPPFFSPPWPFLGVPPGPTMVPWPLGVSPWCPRLPFGPPNGPWFFP